MARKVYPKTCKEWVSKLRSMGYKIVRVSEKPLYDNWKGDYCLIDFIPNPRGRSS